MKTTPTCNLGCMAILSVSFQLGLIMLKAVGLIHSSWFWVLSPLWIGAALYCLLGFILTVTEKS